MELLPIEFPRVLLQQAESLLDSSQQMHLLQPLPELLQEVLLVLVLVQEERLLRVSLQLITELPEKLQVAKLVREEGLQVL